MNMPTITVTETPHVENKNTPADNSRVADARRAARTHESVNGAIGSVHTTTTERSGGSVHEHKHSRGGAADRALSESARTMLANLDKHGDVRGDASAATTVTVREGGTPAAEAKAEPGHARDGKPAPEAKDSKTDETKAPAPASGDAKPEPTKEAEATKAADADLTARYERIVEHNKKLVAELERREAASASDLDDRGKELDAIERDMTAAPMTAIRRLVALNAGVKADAPEVDEIMSGLYKEWTATELKVSLDDGARALIGERRNRALIDRDKREREAARKRDEDRGRSEEGKRRVQAVVKALGEELTTKYAGKYPLLMEHAALFDNVPPEQALFNAISRGIGAGQHKHDDPDEVLVDHYAKELEARYKPRYEALEKSFSARLEPVFEKKFKPAPSTAPVGQAAASASTTVPAADPNQAGVRTITNASASVAPASTPAAPGQPTKDDKPAPKWRNEDERRRYLAGLHFGDA